MKKMFAAGSCAAALAFGGSAAFAEPFPPVSPQFITVDENNLKTGGVPIAPDLHPVPLAQANAFFATLRQENIESRYIVGSCEDRAHFIALLAQRAGLSVGKVWAIAPARYTLLSRELIRISDTSGVTEQVTWGHHVAPVLRVDRGDGDIRTVVIDPTFNSGGFLDLQEWAGRLGPRTLFYFSGTDAYLFTSLDDLDVYDNRPADDPSRLPDDPPQVRLPRWMTNILSGDIQAYDRGYHGPKLAAGMAQNDMAMRIFDRLDSYPSGDRAALRNAIRTEAGVEMLAAGNAATAVSAPTRSALQAFFRTRESHWAARLSAIGG